MPEEPKKPRLTHAILEEHGIFCFDWPKQAAEDAALCDATKAYQEYAAQSASRKATKNSWYIPKLVHCLREILLDHEGLVPSWATKFLLQNERDNFPADAIFEDQDHGILSEREQREAEAKWKDMFVEYRDIADISAKYLRYHASEHDWQMLMESDIFKRYRKEKGSPLDNSTRDPLFDKYETGANSLWQNAEMLRIRKDDYKILPIPKPDLSFGFPVTGLGEAGAKGLEGSAMVFNFSIKKLAGLATKGLISSPSADLGKYESPGFQPGDIKKVERLCFPFAIAELKHGGVGASEKRFCACQAANAASMALTILEKLYHLAEKSENNHHVPPIVTFSCIGAKIRVWIAYSIRWPGGRTAHVMGCVKEIEVTSIWGVLEFHSVFRNLLRWATRVLRPSISSQISRWRLRKSDTSDAGQIVPDTEESKHEFDTGERIKSLEMRNAKLLLKNDSLEIKEANLIYEKFCLEDQIELLERKLKEKPEQSKMQSSEPRSTVGDEGVGEGPADQEASVQGNLRATAFIWEREKPDDKGVKRFTSVHEQNPNKRVRTQCRDRETQEGST